jgi:hypothetical protein
MMASMRIGTAGTIKREMRTHVRRDRNGEWRMMPIGRSIRAVRRRRRANPQVVVHGRGVTIVGSARAIEDYLDAREIDRRMADPENRQSVSWSDLKAKRGL